VATQQVGTTLAEEHRNHTGRPEEGNTLRHTPDGMGGLEGTCESFRPQLSVGPFHGGHGQERSKCLDHRGREGPCSPLSKNVCTLSRLVLSLFISEIGASNPVSSARL
jgi:hypothetical protein